MNEEITLQFIKKFPKLLPTISILNENGIQWLIGGSGSLFLLGNKRVPDDVDIYIQDKDHDKVDILFGINSFQYKSETEDVRNSNPENDHSIQITSHLNITILGNTYNLQITDDVLSNKMKVVYQDKVFFLLPAEDVLIIKAILQRGKDVGKNDLEDIYNFMKICPINKFYLNSRISTLKAEKRVGDIFNTIDLI
ncbi:MAG: nucleotidyltransferase [Candidatus Pacebacteria bacterium]|nr:nucleotidyltransferase [Candidatus Paceibacterota bacterium]